MSTESLTLEEARAQYKALGQEAKHIEQAALDAQQKHLETQEKLQSLRGFIAQCNRDNVPDTGPVPN